MTFGVTYGSISGLLISPEEVRKHCRDDCNLGNCQALLWVDAALELAERHTGRLFAPRTATITLPGFPAGESIRLPVEPVRSVSAIRYRDANGTLMTLSGSSYQTALRFSPPLIAPAAGLCWPDTQCGSLAAVEIDAAVGPTSWPSAAVRQAILLTVGYWHAHRGDGGDPEKEGLPPAAIRLLNLLDTGGYH